MSIVGVISNPAFSGFQRRTSIRFGMRVSARPSGGGSVKNFFDRFKIFGSVWAPSRLYHCPSPIVNSNLLGGRIEGSPTIWEAGQRAGQNHERPAKHRSQASMRTRDKRRRFTAEHPEAPVGHLSGVRGLSEWPVATPSRKTLTPSWNCWKGLSYSCPEARGRISRMSPQPQAKPDSSSFLKALQVPTRRQTYPLPCTRNKQLLLRCARHPVS